MKFVETILPGAFVIELEPHEDVRGFFARAFCTKEFKTHGLNAHVAQSNISYNHVAGTLRGMHYQNRPALEAKTVRCIHGAVYDVIIDLRPDSPTYLAHFGAELSSENRCALYVPELCAHGYQTLTDGATVLYHVSEPYAPAHERGVRCNDPIFGIQWPLPVTMISEKDVSWPLFECEDRRSR